MAKRPLALRIAGLQYRFVREMNDVHIFLNQVLPLLKDAKEDYEHSTHRKDRRYYVPAVDRVKFAKRTDQELKNIYHRFMNGSLYEAFLVMAVSRFESLIAEVLKLVFVEYPQKLGIAVHGVAPCKTVPTELLLRADSIEDALQKAIDGHLNSVMYGAPHAYLAYVGEVVGVDTTAPEFERYIEIKATRDLLVHSTGIVNLIYLAKAGSKRRGQVGDPIGVDRKYFDRALATLKRLSGIIKRDTANSFPVSRRPTPMDADAKGTRGSSPSR
ncbi:MAG: hypothetical protein HYR72_05855 [Deltaproteobacteria bacterium]|nr:hypothetical protein [Deltaproteobacteria bacterium]MBI3387727.1 hypothetical protein [Deltaproteobacteria bacterium]